MSTISQEALDDLRQWIAGRMDEQLLGLEDRARWRYDAPDERHHWFRLGRLVAAEWERRRND